MARVIAVVPKQTSKRFKRGIHIIVLAQIVAWTPVHLESERWWSSPVVASTLGITTEQSISLEELYERSLPAREQASEEVFDLTAQVARRIDAGDYSQALLRTSSDLTKARSTLCALRRQMLDLTTRALTARQREQLTRLVAERRFRE